MALPHSALKLLAPYLRGEVLSLGYPDLLVSKETIQEMFGYMPSKFTDANKWHGVKDPLPDTEELFDHLGVKLTVVDFTKDRGMETIADLNYPQEFGKFDLVIDPGTLEHCFNIAQAFVNAAAAVKVGGRIFHLSPMTMINHGFYNLCPTLFYDFYTQNGWEIDHLMVIPCAALGFKVTERFTTISEHMIRALVRRQTDEELKMPIQTKYLRKIQARLGK